MYIAFRWLTGLTTTMWIAVCCIDAYINKNGESGLIFNEYTYKNSTSEQKHPLTGRCIEDFKYKNSYSPDSIAMLHCLMFLAGAVAVFVFNNKEEIFSFTKNKIAEIEIRVIMINIKQLTRKTIYCTSAVYILCKNVYNLLMNYIDVLKRKKDEEQDIINFMYIKKLKEISEEKKNLSQLLVTAVNESRSIKSLYQLELAAKNKLLQHIDDTQKRIEENSCRYVSFQQLYLVTHKENIFLKARIRKLTKQKEDAETNLLRLINEVYKSKSAELKSYCSRLIVQTKDNLLNLDVRAEIKKFLSKSKTPEANFQSSHESGTGININSSSRSTSSTRITELNDDINLLPLVSDAPRLKGLPGECVWTANDRDNIRQKLYEYDYDEELDNGDTIRRIKQYSVYFDKECLLDYSNSKTLIYETNTDDGKGGMSKTVSVYPVGFVTGSEAFQKFLRDNDPVVLSPDPGPPLLCG